MITDDPNVRARIMEQTLIEMRGREFQWGEHDCLMFCANHVLAYTGKDYAESFRGNYSSRRGAEAMMVRAGASSITDFVSAILQEPTQPVFNARVGWVMAFKDIDDEVAIGVCAGANGMFLQRTGEILLKPLAECLCCWRV